MAGGVAGGRPLRAVLLGGAAGGFVGPDELDLELSFEATRAAGATLGSGVVMVFDDTVDLVAGPAADRRVLPRRVVRPVRALPGRHRPPAGGAPAARGRTAARLASTTSWPCSTRSPRAMRDASICGLGQTAANAIDSAVRELRVFAGGAADERHTRHHPPHRRARDRRRGGARPARARRSSTPAGRAGSTSRRSATARR